MGNSAYFDFLTGRGDLMDWVLATLIGLLYGSGLFLMMRRTLIQLIIGLGLLSHGANLLIFYCRGVWAR